MATKAPAKADVRFETLVDELDTLVDTLEKGEIPLEDALNAYERGVKLVQLANAQLSVMDARLEKLNTDGSLEPMDVDVEEPDER